MKRIFDFVVASICLCALAPFLIFIAVAIAIDLGQPIFFRQTRPGYLGKPFVMLKFRTMRESTLLSDNPLPDSDRITRFGAFLRKTSLDELPELWNVLKGEMSLVGPRPLLMEYLRLYSPTQARRHEAVPGITGWAQINGRNAINWDQKFTFDVWYVDNRSFMLDMKILYHTVKKVLAREGISAPNAATMPKFTGNHL